MEFWDGFCKYFQLKPVNNHVFPCLTLCGQVQIKAFSCNTLLLPNPPAQHTAARFSSYGMAIASGTFIRGKSFIYKHFEMSNYCFPHSFQVLVQTLISTWNITLLPSCPKRLFARSWKHYPRDMVIFLCMVSELILLFRKWLKTKSWNSLYLIDVRMMKKPFPASGNEQ